MDSGAHRALPVFWARPTSLGSAYTVAAIAATTLAFATLFYEPLLTLVRDWVTSPDAGHGLLLAPAALWYAKRIGVSPDAQANVGLGAGLIVLAVAMRYAAALAAEPFTMRASMIVALLGLCVYCYGTRQAARWWLPFVLLAFAIPLPELITQAIALPLQFTASRAGAALLEMRSVPVRLSGNVIQLPGRELFVTEACSGLRSLTALMSTTVLFAAAFTRFSITRTLLVASAIPVAIGINAIRVFLTGFFVYFVSPAMGTGFMHVTEGWLLFLVSLATMGALTFCGYLLERAVRPVQHA